MPPRPLKISEYPKTDGRTALITGTPDEIVEFVNRNSLADRFVVNYELIFEPVDATNGASHLKGYKYYVVARRNRIAVVEDIRL